MFAAGVRVDTRRRSKRTRCRSLANRMLDNRPSPLASKSISPFQSSLQWEGENTFRSRSTDWCIKTCLPEAEKIGPWLSENPPLKDEPQNVVIPFVETTLPGLPVGWSNNGRTSESNALKTGHRDRFEGR